MPPIAVRKSIVAAIAFSTLCCAYTIPKERPTGHEEKRTEYRQRMRQEPRDVKVERLLGEWNVIVSAWRSEGYGGTRREQRLPRLITEQFRSLTINDDATWVLDLGGTRIVGQWRVGDGSTSSEFELILNRTPRIPGLDESIAFEVKFGESGILLTRRTSDGHGESGVDWELRKGTL